MACAADVLWAALAAGGTRTAVRDAAIELSAAQLLQDMRARRARLDALGARRVALALDNGADWVAWDLALLASGRVCVPVPGFFSPQQQAHVLDSAGVDTLIGDPIVAARVDGFEEVDEGIFQRVPHAVPALPAGTVKITYTSGTTGQPKGVCLDAGAQLAVARSLAEVSTACGVERHLSVLPLATLLENVGGVYAAILAGARVDLVPQAALGMTGASGFDVARFIRTLHEHQPHSLILLPQLLLALVTAAEQGIKLPDSLRFVAVGGARVSPALLVRAEALGLPIFEGYGLSECASVVCVNTPAAPSAAMPTSTLRSQMPTQRYPTTPACSAGCAPTKHSRPTTACSPPTAGCAARRSPNATWRASPPALTWTSLRIRPTPPPSFPLNKRSTHDFLPHPARPHRRRA